MLEDRIDDYYYGDENENNDIGKERLGDAFHHTVRGSEYEGVSRKQNIEVCFPVPFFVVGVEFGMRLTGNRLWRATGHMSESMFIG